MLNADSKLENVMALVHPCRCHACENSCNFGSGAFADGEVERLAKSLNLSEEEAKEKYLEVIERFNTKRFRPKILRENDKPYGKCVFYDKEKGCKIHEVKPLECKIAMGCKAYGEELILWYDLNHFLDRKNIESLRQYRNYLESGGKALPGAQFNEVFTEEILKKIDSYDDLKDDTDWAEKAGLKEPAKKRQERQKK